ncbi:MAG: PRC-barrel domain-containing protein [Thermoplasmata archaeon]|nr:PRC-barrel domain-containing protein [Thermoplasmata archaeon]MCI4342482.1 PRC-barrel domain-containing protein [Thermoplasmata archaeon]
MLVESTELMGRQMYTPDGRLLGEVSNLVVDVEGAKIDGLYLEEPSGLLVEDSKPVSVPYRWVSAVNDVVLLKFFPRRVSVKKGPAKPAPASAAPAAAAPAR